MAADAWPIRRLLEWTEKYFREKGIDSPRLDAQLLLAHTLGCKKIDLYVRSDEEPPEAKRTAFKDLIRRRLEGCPVAYLIGQREFYQLTLEITPAVLIPRPETEILVMEALRQLKGKESPRVLDIGTGSGCIALTIAQQHKTAVVTATDRSPEALAIARKNATTHRLIDRVRFLEGDLFAPLGEELFDLIVSNPPYIPTSDISGLMKEVRDFEPISALDGGSDGLAMYRRLIPDAAAHLVEKGGLLLEIGSTQEAAVRKLIEGTGAFESLVTFVDLQKHPRVIGARRMA